MLIGNTKIMTNL